MVGMINAPSAEKFCQKNSLDRFSLGISVAIPLVIDSLTESDLT